MKGIIKVLKKDRVLRLTVVTTLAIAAFVVGGLLFYPPIMIGILITMMIIVLTIMLGCLVYISIYEITRYLNK